MTDPALDQPRLEDYDDISEDTRFPHANGEIYFAADRDSDLFDLRWHWHERSYARTIRIRIDAPIYTSSGISSEQLDDVLPLAIQLYPGYQETIYGVEGVIVSKRIFAPLDSYYDRSLLWMMEAQAEGDRLIQIRVEIDWGEPLEQRMVDGLLVAQNSPGDARGAHKQRNAESTRVFGAAEGRPDLVHFPSDSQALLVYHVLVAGQVDLPLILALSDVGEQVAWNGFLVQRDISRAFQRSCNRWHDVTHRGRLWSSDTVANKAVQDAKIAAQQRLARFRSGFAPDDRAVSSVHGLVDIFDTFAPEHSRALLDTLRRVAERNRGALPLLLPTLPRQKISAPTAVLPGTAAAYLSALQAHQRRHPDREWLSTHAKALTACADALVASAAAFNGPSADLARNASRALVAASHLATMLDLAEEAACWARQANACDGSVDLQPAALTASAATSIWALLGISADKGNLTVRKAWSSRWNWWALLNLPCSPEEGADEISMLWDGATLHATRAVTFDGPLAIRSNVRAYGSDEHSLDLRFRLDSELFIPAFQKDDDSAS